jgi:pyroglutamyl-peptidase
LTGESASGSKTVTTLLTGFEAFGGAEVNVSELVVDAVRATRPDGVHCAVLPTSYRRAEAAIEELIRTHDPDCILMLGLSEKAKAITFEQTALNFDDCAMRDNDGDIRTRSKIRADAPVGYWNSLPLERMADIARTLGHQVVFSRDAGGFVCNHTFFAAARQVALKRPDCRAGFVHLPPLGGPGEELVKIVTLVERWIADVLSHQRET